MADLMGTMSIALGSLRNSQEALDVTSNNIANMNTAGYSRQRANIVESDPINYTPLQFGTGATIANIQSIRDQILNYRIYDETQQQAGANAFLSPMQQVQASLNETSGVGLQGAISSFFNSMSQLSTDPASIPLRQSVLTAGQTLATAFNNAANNLTTVKNSMDNQVQDTVKQINSLAQSIAQLNARISESQTTGQSPGVLVDQRDELIHQMSQLINVSVVQGSNGVVTVATTFGAALVVGQQDYPLQLQTSATTGMQQVISNGNDITSIISGGQLGGTLKVRDQAIPALQTKLDTLASGIATAVNSTQTAGFDLNAAAGQKFFSVPATLSGTAASIKVNLTDPALIAASQSGVSGDNSNALALANLQNQSIVGGQKPIDFYANTISQLGSDIQSATTDSNSQGVVLQQLQSQRASVSGVSLDEEAANLVRYQRAYQAAARVVSVIDSLTTTAIHLGQQ